MQRSEKISIGRDSGVHEDQCESGAMLALGPRDRRSVSQSSLGGQDDADDCGGGAEDLDLQVVARWDAGLLREPETGLLLYLLHHVAHHYPVIVGDAHLDQRDSGVRESVESVKIKLTLK